MAGSPRHDLLFTYDFPPMGGGIARWMAAIARESPPGSLRVSTGSMVGSEAVDADLVAPIDRITTPSQRLRTLQGTLRWSRRAAQLAQNPAARFAWAGTFRPAAWPAWWARTRRALPYGVIWHGGDLLILRDKARRHPARRAHWERLLRGAAVFVANSRWTADVLSGLLDEWAMASLADRIQVVHPGTTPALWQTTPAAVEAFRHRHVLPAGRYLVTLARLVPHKGVDTGIDLLQHLLANAPDTFTDLRYLVIGRGPHLDALRHLAAVRGVADRVHFLTDIDDEDLAAALGVGEIYLGLSREEPGDVEGFGIALIEAAAAGLPVVAHRSGGMTDAVTDGDTGWLVNPADARHAHTAVRMLLADPEGARALGASGRDRVQRNFTWSAHVARLAELAATFGRPTR